MVDGWKPVVIPTEIYEKAREYYEEHKGELKLRDGIRSLTAFIGFCLREYLKEKGWEPTEIIDPTLLKRLCRT